MDNFMDTLAQKYNAQEMIKANSQAEANEMQHLQEQVEAYEAVLQEMRKLNYKNTELTEKMYSLVDESIEKVRTLQIEANSGEANTELISREMSEAVTSALGEALSNMDATVAQSLSESIAIALSKPTEDLKQSSEIVGSSVQGMKDVVAQIEESAKDIRSSAEDIIMAADDVRQSNQSINELVKAQSETERIFNEQLKNSLTQVMENSRQVISTLEEMKAISNAVLEASQKAEEEKEDYLDDEPEEQEEEQKPNPEFLALQEQINELAESLNGSLQTLLMSAEASALQLTSLQENNAVSQSSVQQLAIALEEAKNISAETKSAIYEVQNMQNLQNQAMQELINGKGNSEELQEELQQGLRSNKLAVDDAKTTLKSSFDSAIYGLKQDNREIVEFMQRMNTNILAKFEDADKELKEQEEQEKEEKKRQELEERFKANEDFMHKESVKVYRNVQAVLNEKVEKQTESTETQIRQLKAQVGQVKTISIIGMVLAAAGVIIQVLRIFGII